MGRWARSMALVRASWAVIRQDSELLVLPLLSGITSLALSAALYIPLIVTSMHTGVDGEPTVHLTPFHWIGMILASIVLEVSGALEWALGVFAEWAGAAGQVRYEINRDFNPAGLDAQQMTALVGAVQAGKLSDAEFFDLLQRHDVVDARKTFEEHQAEIEIQGGPVRPDMAMDAPMGGDTGAAVDELEAAIARHERHMNGTEATSDASQQKMMDEMKAALAALKGKKAKPMKGMAM